MLTFLTKNSYKYGFIYLLLAGAVLPHAALSDERILSYHSDIVISADASMRVNETIQVQVEGNKIRRGIYRDFPTDYKDSHGNKVHVDFEVLSVSRNDLPARWSSSKRGNGVRVRIGDPKVLLEHGVHTYSIRYRSSRQIGFFEDHDELYWNVTGTGWDFMNDKVSARVSLPGLVKASELKMEGYTGGQGGVGRDYVVRLEDGAASIESSRALAMREGLTLVLSWPKGVVTEPDSLQKMIFILKDNLGILLSLLALLFSAIYLFQCWRRHGVDPAAGVIFPHYAPPTNISPASARYIMEMSYDNTVSSAAIVSLAVKGYLSITQEGDTYTLVEKNSDEKLAPGEQTLLQGFFVKDSVLELKQKNQPVISAAQRAHKKSLQKDYRNIYFKKNAGLLLPSFVASVLSMIVIVSSSAFVGWVLPFFLVNLLLHLLFLYLMQAPTPMGRAFMDKLEGFKLYLEVAEKDDLNLPQSPELTPALFERFLPFAMALDVELAWAEKFTKVFAALNVDNATGHPFVWYSGSFDPMRMHSFAGDIGAGFTTAISSAATPPGSTSGSGGGSSGGGGGGGGGGGW